MRRDRTPAGRRGRAWLAGGAGLTAVATIVGASARRSITQRATAVEDPYADEDFDLIDDDPGYVVTTPDGVPLAVREVGPGRRAGDHASSSTGSVFAWARSTFSAPGFPSSWARTSGWSSTTSAATDSPARRAPETYTLTQLGRDLETVLK